MATLEACLENADELAARVVDGWDKTTVASHENEKTPAYRALFEKACSYRTAKGIVENHRKSNCLSEQEVSDETETRQAFALAYFAFAGEQEAA
jgi:hypothetical protein